MLIVLVPSRGRPNDAKALLRCCQQTCILPDTQMWFLVDESDQTSEQYPYHKIVQSQGMISALNTGAMLSLEEDPFAIGFMGDDHRPRTVGWDECYVKALKAMGTGVVYGNDLLQREKMPTQVAMTADIVRTLGYYAPPSFKHLCVDLCWKDWGEGIGKIRYLPDVVIEHMHPLNSKVEWDDGYKRVNAKTVAEADNREYFRWKREDLPRDVAKLRGLL